MTVKIHPSWNKLLADQFEQPYFSSLVQFVRSEYVSGPCFPPASLIFNAFNLCPVYNVKVVIIGQDPYHEPHQAHGLCFSVVEGTPIPPSLRNIFKEIQSDVGTPPPLSGDLTRWAKQGVLLLNATLSVRAHHAASHQGHGWETFTDAVISALSHTRSHIVYILWGAYATSKSSLIDSSNNCILTSPHPSPLSAHRGFFGNRHFSRANAYLLNHGITPIIW